MTWYFGGAARIAVLFVLNAVFVHRLRARRSMPRAPVAVSLRRPQSGARIVGGLLFAAALTVCLGAGIVAPGSAFGQLMANRWVVVCTIPYMMAIGAVVTVAAELRRRRATRAR